MRFRNNNPTNYEFITNLQIYEKNTRIQISQQNVLYIRKFACLAGQAGMLFVIRRIYMIIDARDRETIKNIIATVAYYDALNYPLTAFEAWKYLMCAQYYDEAHVHGNVSLGDVVRLLQHESVRVLVEQSNGMYVLKGRKELVAQRIRQEKISASKLKRLREVVRIFKYVPFVRMIGVTGTLAMRSASNKSDWDLLVVLRSGKIWTGRTLVTAVAHLIGKRRYGDKIKDRVCLNYFITDKTLEVITKDLFSAHEYSFLLPLFDGTTYEKFQLKNRWIKKIKPQYSVAEILPLVMCKDDIFSKFVRHAGEKILSWGKIEDFLGALEHKKIMQNPNTKRENGLIYADSEALIFLPDPKGPRIFQKFKDNITMLYS